MNNFTDCTGGTGSTFFSTAFKCKFDDYWKIVVGDRLNTCEVRQLDRNIKDVIFNDPATIVLWKDGTKTVVKCGPYDEYDPEKGLALCMLKKQCGNKGNYNNLFRKYLPAYREKEEVKKDIIDIDYMEKEMSDSLYLPPSGGSK